MKINRYSSDVKFASCSIMRINCRLFSFLEGRFSSFLEGSLSSFLGGSFFIRSKKEYGEESNGYHRKIHFGSVKGIFVYIKV